MEINEQWAQPLHRDCGAVRQRRLADGIAIEVCHLRLGHQGDHDPYVNTTAWIDPNLRITP